MHRSSAPRVAQAAWADCRVSTTVQPAYPTAFTSSKAGSWQVCATGRGREAHLRVQPGAPHHPQSVPRPLTPRSVRRRRADWPRSTAASRSSEVSRV